MNYFVDTKQICAAYIQKMDTLMGYPNEATKTLTYAKPREHQGIAGVFVVPIKAVHSPKHKRKVRLSEMDNASSNADRLKFKDRGVLDAELAFKYDDDLP